MTYPDAPAYPETHVYHWRSTEKGDDGKAYESDNVLPRYSGGLTKREYFAAQSLQGIIVWDATVNEPQDAGKIERIAEQAVAVADALIAALNAETPKDAA